MKLAEALMERADLQCRLEQLKQRLNQNAQYQEGEEPAESPEALLAEYRQAATKLEQLIVKINLANNRIQLESGQLMVEALAKRDRLKAEHNTLINLADAATQTFDRYSRSEIKTLAAIDVKNIRKQIDEIAKQHRQLDTQIQQANWLSEI
ncbi:DIP1984 family protein [Haemophilus parahaemolyticus]|uniref:DIP1984 family protein n=1 Tax=Haemophilus parahaemolyticus TaxID=735 RepID=UPI0028D10C16|nr:DIP1984 family protein [Haemophilus parahaemolyticus]